MLFSPSIWLRCFCNILEVDQAFSPFHCYKCLFSLSLCCSVNHIWLCCVLTEEEKPEWHIIHSSFKGLRNLATNQPYRVSTLLKICFIFLFRILWMIYLLKFNFNVTKICRHIFWYYVFVCVYLQNVLGKTMSFWTSDDEDFRICHKHEK